MSTLQVIQFHWLLLLLTYTTYRECSKPASPSDFACHRTDPGFFSDGWDRLWETGFPKNQPGQAWVTCRPQGFSPNFNLQNAISIIEINVRVDIRDFRHFNICLCDHSARRFTFSRTHFQGLSWSVLINTLWSNTGI